MSSSSGIDAISVCHSLSRLLSKQEQHWNLLSDDSIVVDVNNVYCFSF